MLCVKTKIAPSDINGIGLFAEEKILAGSVVWKFNPALDILLPKEEVEKLTEIEKEQFLKYAFFDKDHKKYMLCGDDGRFFNHSENPNCDESVKDLTTAIKNIEIGEELTVDYRVFYGDINDHSEII